MKALMVRWLMVMILTWPIGLSAQFLLIPMDGNQTNHLKGYGVAYWVIAQGDAIQWLLNHRGGSFLLPDRDAYSREMLIRGVSFERLTAGAASGLLAQVTSENTNTDAVKLEKAPKVAVYSPKTAQPWDDAVTMVLTYAEIPYQVVYDAEVMEGKLKDYDWLHLHHEDFTGQFGKFWEGFQHQKWYQDQVAEAEAIARQYGFQKVSALKLAVAKKILGFLGEGGFLFAMCSATDTYDIALAADGVDICEVMYDGDAADPQAQQKLDFSRGLAFQNFKLEENPLQYEYSDIDVTRYKAVPEELDFFMLFEFSAKWDPVPTMLCQNHTTTLKGFMGQTTAFAKELLKPGVLIMGELQGASEARYIHGNYGQGMWTYYGGHDPEDYQHLVNEEPTDLNRYPNSPGYRLILNNILFPASRKKKQKT